jgi:hypothetical protein
VNNKISLENLKAGAVAGFDVSLLNFCVLLILGWVFGIWLGWCNEVQ